MNEKKRERKRENTAVWDGVVSPSHFGSSNAKLTIEILINNISNGAALAFNLLQATTKTKSNVANVEWTDLIIREIIIHTSADLIKLSSSTLLIPQRLML